MSKNYNSRVKPITCEFNPAQVILPMKLVIALRNYHLNSKEHEVKGQPINMHDEHDITFTDQTDTIDIERHLSKTKIHSNKLQKKKKNRIC